MLACWMLMSYLKSTDNRRGASFAVNPVREIEANEEDILPIRVSRKKGGKK